MNSPPCRYASCSHHLIRSLAALAVALFISPLARAQVGVSTFAGTGALGSADGPASWASFRNPCGIAVDGTGNVYVADRDDNKIRKIAGGVVSTSAWFQYYSGIAVDGNGNVYVADTGSNKIRKIAGGVVSTFAGTGTPGSADGPASSASFSMPEGIAVDGNGNVYVADTYNNKIRKIAGGVVSTFAGTGAQGSADGPASSASFSMPEGIAVDGTGNVYVADTDNHKIRKITVSGGSSSATNTVPIVKGVTRLTEIWRGEALEGAYQLACDGDTVYWLRRKGLDQPSQLYRLTPGASASQLIATDPEYLRGMVFDRQSIYLTAIDRILRVPKASGGRVEVLAWGEPQASDIVQHGEHLYWTNPGFPEGIWGRPRGPLDGTVRSMNKGGGSVATILGGETTLKLLAHDDDSLYLATSRGVIALPLRGGTSQMLFHDARSSVSSGAAHGDYLYFTSGGELLRLPRRGGTTVTLAHAMILLQVVVLGEQIYLARNEAWDRGSVVQKAGVLRLDLSPGQPVELAGLAFRPARLAAGASAVYVLDAPLLGRPGAPRLLVGRPGDNPARPTTGLRRNRP